MTNAGLADKGARTYLLVSVWLVVAAIIHLFVVLVAYPSAIYWLSYYVPNYEFGFVRRGLGGEIIRMLPDGYYFTAVYTMLGASVVVWLIALGVLMWRILSGQPGRERRVMLALLVPVLPFSLTYALYSPHPELFGMAALVALGLFLTNTRTARPRLIACALYGSAIAALAFVHEAIPLQLALGAVLAIVVLPRDMSPALQRICLMLAVVPGIVAVLLAAGLGRKQVGSLLCEQIPHRMIENPYAASTSVQKTLDYMFGRVESKSDYHDWMCRYATPILESNFSDGVQMVAQFGVLPLLASFIVGLLYFVGTTWAIQFFSGVPVTTFLRELRGNYVLAVLALALMVPVFMTAVDWTRWWILITFDVAVVYIMYAASRPEIAKPASRSEARIFVWVVALLAIVPTGAALHIGGSNF